MDPSRKRMIRMTVALTAAVLLASALVWESFSAAREELTASQLLRQAKPGQQYILAGTVLPGYSRTGSSLVFRVRDPRLHEAATIRYTGIVPDPFAAGRGRARDRAEGQRYRLRGTGELADYQVPVEVPSGSGRFILIWR